MKDKLFQCIQKILKRLYCYVMWAIYKYKTKIICKDVDQIEDEYKKDIRNYWKRYYRRINVSDYEWYQTKNNLRNIKLIPDTVFHSKIEPFFNDITLIDAFSNKCYYNLFFQGFRMPYTIAKNISGTYLDDDFKVITLEMVVERCMKEDEIIIKPAIDSGGGRNISFLQMKEKDADHKLLRFLENYHENFVIQRVVLQHEILRNINPTSLNTVRVQSFLYKEKVYILASSLKMGLLGARVDNLCQGAISVSIKENSAFHSVAYDGEGNKYDQHPNGYDFKGKKMPEYDKIIECVKILHPRFVNFGLIGWDIALDEDGEVVIIEFNLIDTCIRAAQLSNGPFLKDLTDEVLDEVFGKKIRLGKKQ